jgi:hypothetical protein
MQRVPEPTDDDAMRRSYIRVIVSWLATLAVLYAFQE